jgi:uridylate kinase
MKKLRVMDTTSISLCSENEMPIVVFNLNVPGNIVNAVLKQSVGTRIC